MSKPKWKDETSYSRGERGEPRTWVVKSGLLSVIVSRHIHYPGSWLASCRELDIDNRELEAKDLPGAKREALTLVRARLNRLLRDADAIETEARNDE